MKFQDGRVTDGGGDRQEAGLWSAGEVAGESCLSGRDARKLYC